VVLFDQELAELGVDENSYVVIVTRGHAHDKTVLAKALRSNACYMVEKLNPRVVFIDIDLPEKTA